MSVLEPHLEGTPVAKRRQPKRHRGEAARVYLKSRITNGSALLPTANGNSIWARLVKDTLGGLMAHCGGAGMVSETQKLAARRVSVLEAELIHLEDNFAIAREQGREPEPAALDLYGRLADRQRRLADPLGWQRTARDVGPSLGDFMRLAAATPAG
jgi:hypothetical protein